MRVIGLDGELHDRWDTGARAYLGMTVPRFPNLFLLYGPNTNLGHNSIIFMTERQGEYVARKIARLLNEDLRTLEVRPEAQARFDRQVQDRLAGTVWAGDCASWYKTADGRITNNWSGLASAFALTLARPDDQAWRASR